MRLIDLDPYWAKLPTFCGAAVGAVGTALSFLSEIAMQALGVPLPVVMASAVAPVGIIAAVAAAMLWRNPWLPFIAGMAVLLGLRHWLGA